MDVLSYHLEIVQTAKYVVPSKVPKRNNNMQFSSFFQGVTDMLLKGVQFTHTSANHMMKGTPVGDAFK